MTPFDFTGHTIAEARRRLTARLTHRCGEPAAADARHLIETATGFDHGTLLREPDTLLPAEAARVLAVLAARREGGEPLSRILGAREFCGLTLQVRPDVLDPREDSEALVRIAVALRPDRTAPMRIVDLGTGSGALLCALLSTFPNATGLGIDRSLGACYAARENVRRAGVAERAVIACGDWSAPLARPFDLVVSNPPYIVTADLATLPPEVRDHDPPLALDGGADGLRAYRAILGDARRIASRRALLVLEIGAGMQAAVGALMAAAGLKAAGTERDAGCHVRALAGEFA